jgi:hypothetical protein
MRNRDNDQNLQKYLLGELPEAEKLALEERYFRDQQLLERIVQAESDLNDKYVRNQLPAGTRERYEQFYLSHPIRRERSLFAEALAAKIGPGRSTIDQPAWFDRILHSLRRPRLAWAVSLAVLSIAIVAVWFLIQTRQVRREELARAESERTAQEKRERELQELLAGERLRADQLTKELQNRPDELNTTPSPQKKSPIFATLALTISGTRAGETGPPAVLRIPAAAEQVKLELKLSDHNYASYRAVLQTAGAKTIFTSGRLTTTKRGSSLTVLVPAEIFSTGDYLLTLRGTDKNGEVEDVSKSIFHVEAK